MIKSYFAKSSLGFKIIFIFVTVFVGISVGSIVISVFAKYMDNVHVLKLLQMTQTVFTFVLPSFVLAYFLGSGSSYFKFKRIRSYKILLILLLVMPIAVPAVNLFKSLNDLVVLPDFLHSVESWMQQMEQQSLLLTEKFLSVSTGSGLFFNILVLAVLPAFGEEIFFRGILQTTLGEKINPHYAIWITAFVFSAIHMQFYGFLPRFFLGGMLGYLFMLTGSIWAPILAHFVNNAIVVVVFFLSFNNFVKIDIDGIGTNKTWWFAIVSVGFVFFLFNRLQRAKKKEVF